MLYKIALVQHKTIPTNITELQQMQKRLSNVDMMGWKLGFLDEVGIFEQIGLPFIQPAERGSIRSLLPHVPFGLSTIQTEKTCTVDNRAP